MESGDNSNSDSVNKTEAPATPIVPKLSFKSGDKTPSIDSDAHHSQVKNRRRLSPSVVIAVIAIILAASSTAVAIYAVVSSRNIATTVTTSGSGGSYYSGNTTQFESTSVAAIAQKVTPAVVSIVTSSTSSSSAYFGYDNSTTEQSAGTGMIVTADGYVLTNKHVIDGADEIKIITDAGDTYTDVTVAGEDPLNDVAYLKINGASNLPTISLGDSKSIAVGQPVLAIGNALGAYQNSVTQGIVSGTGRSVTAGDSTGSITEYLSDMIQTDAAINPGNSGGPLVNASGDVIGMNTAVSSSAQSMGFAIPITAVRGMLNSIISNNKAERAYIGLTYITITADVKKTYNLTVDHGAYVYNASKTSSSAIVKGGPADRAGIQTGDVITKIGNAEVGTAGSISTLVGEYKVGDTIQVTYIRDGSEHTVAVTLAAYSK